MNRDNGKTIAGRQIPPGYSLMEDPVSACFHVMGPNGHVGSIERRFAADDTSGFADEVVQRCCEDMERRCREKYEQAAAEQLHHTLNTGMTAAEVARMQQMAIPTNKSPAALARFHRESVERGITQDRSHVPTGFTELFNELAKKGKLPSRGDRFGEPPIKPSGKIRVNTKPPVTREHRPSAERECRDIERKGARAWLLARHNDFVRDVRLP